MVLSEAVSSVTRNMIVPKAFDTITKGSPFLLTLLANAESWKTGLKYEAIIKYQDTTNGGNAGISDRLDTDRQNTRTKMEFEPKLAYKPVVVANIETTLNSGDEQVLSLLETEFDSQAQSLHMVLASNLFTGNGSGNSWDSLANAADDATNFSTYGGKSRSTYPTIKGYYLASTGALTQAKLATAHDAVSVGTEYPNKIVTTKLLWSVYESTLSSTVFQNYVTSGYPMMDAFGMVGSKEGRAAEAGFNVLFYRGIPVIKDESVPTGKVYLIDTNFFGFKGIKIDGLKQLNFKKNNDGVPNGVVGKVKSTLGFNFRDLMSPVDQLAEVGHLIYSGNFISTNPRLQGQLNAATA
jgi:hypothetical protein